jgi:hypothetical protein
VPPLESGLFIGSLLFLLMVTRRERHWRAPKQTAVDDYDENRDVELLEVAWASAGLRWWRSPVPRLSPETIRGSEEVNRLQTPGTFHLRPRLTQPTVCPVLLPHIGLADGITRNALPSSLAT